MTVEPRCDPIPRPFLHDLLIGVLVAMAPAIVHQVGEGIREHLSRRHPGNTGNTGNGTGNTGK